MKEILDDDDDNNLASGIDALMGEIDKYESSNKYQSYSNK